ncbi:hypothetical protein M8Z33_03345 [Streptomyces sp. ZAF1911]|uniref:hypothetical protein n=1 Tax=Streptomyces sp. ZAF1911 TaxID=2944129 RepID=UPI00237B9F9A|nr:hypothetical protein [Streptomyces sp. ZAF1911]MDD9375724.1 hypothetical protein [Streptomyces sp. ZAF1911]
MTATPAATHSTPGGAAFASAFADSADVRGIDVGNPALQADVASGADGRAHVLTVRNGTDEEQELFPEAFLPHGTDPLLFLGGASTTSERDGRLVARLAPHGIVRLGRIIPDDALTDRSQEHPA